MATTTDTEEKKRADKAPHKDISKIALEVGIARKRASARPRAKDRVRRTPDYRLASSRISPRRGLG